MQVKVRKLYDPYKHQTFARVEDLLVLLEDAKDHPKKYDEQVITRLAEELMGKKKIEPIMERPF